MAVSHRYIVFPSYKGRYDYYRFNIINDDSDPYDSSRVRSYDKLLHRTLSQIFHERHLTNCQIRKLTSAPKKHEDSIFRMILERRPALGKLLLKRSNLSLLWIAILSCYHESAELLLRSGAKVDEPYGLDAEYCLIDQTSNVLHALLQMYPSSWNERLIRLVIDYGVDIEAQDIDGSTPLHLAVINGRVKMAEMLLQKGVNVNAVNLYLVTPLLYAGYSREVEELLPLLMKHGADINVSDVNGWNLFYILTLSPYRDNFDLIRAFIEQGISPGQITNEGQCPPINAAILRERIDLVNLFLDHGANVNALTGRYPNTFPLDLATEYCGNPAVLLTLLKRGANIDLQNYRGETALHALTFSDENTVEKMKLLLSVGADMFAEDYDGWTPFELIPLENEEGETLRQTMLKTLALRKACLQPSVEFKDEIIVKKEYPELWSRYQDCVDEIARIKSTKFIKTGNFYELLTKCQCRIVALMRNPEFRSKFRLYDFSDFPIYAEDLLEAFERAEHYYQSVIEQEALIDQAVYNTWPYLITRKMARFALRCEICKLKKTVRASRTSK